MRYYGKRKGGFKRRGDTIQARSNLDFDVTCATIQFYGNSYNSPSDY
jgi:hypothetical protein